MMARDMEDTLKLARPLMLNMCISSLNLISNCQLEMSLILSELILRRFSHHSQRFILMPAVHPRRENPQQRESENVGGNTRPALYALM